MGPYRRDLGYLVVHGGAASHSLIGLAEHFDPTSPLAAADVESNAELVADLLVDGLRLS